jgi:hypothetical protein
MAASWGSYEPEVDLFEGGSGGNEADIEDPLVKAVKQSDYDTVKSLLQKGTKFGPEIFVHAFRDPATPRSMMVMAELVNRSTPEVLAEGLWGSDIYYQRLALPKIIESKDAKLIKEVTDSATTYIQVGIKLGHPQITNFLLPYIKANGVLDLVNYATDSGRPNALESIFDWISTKYNLFDTLKWNPDSEKFADYQARINKYAALLKGTKYQDLTSSLASVLLPEHQQIREKFNSWYTRNDLAIICHIDPNCGQCGYELQMILNELIKNGGETYVAVQYQLRQAEFDKLGLKINNDTDLIGNEYYNFHPLCWLTLPVRPRSGSSTAGAGVKDVKVGDVKEVYWFSVLDFKTLLDNRKNPYTNAALSAGELKQIEDRVKLLKSYNVNYEKVLPLTDAIEILTDHKKFVVLPGQAEKLVAAPTVEEQLAKLLNKEGCYYDVGALKTFATDAKGLSLLRDAVTRELDIRLPADSSRSVIYQALINNIKLGGDNLSATRVAVVNTILDDISRLS